MALPPLLSGTNIAAANAAGNQRVYIQDIDSNIRQFASVPPTDSIITTSSTAAKPNTSLAALRAFSTPQFRVYYLNSNNELQELFYSSDGFWTPGSLNAAHIKVAPYSDIAVFVLDDSTRALQVNLYAQQANNVIQEYQLNANGQWVPNKTFDTALAGTKIAVTFWQDTPGNGATNHVRLYYQDPSNNVVERCYDPNTGWTNGGFNAQGESVLAFCTLSCAAFLEPPNSLRVYVGSSDGTIWEWSIGTNPWKVTGKFGPVAPNSNSAVVHWKGPHLRAYVQDPTGGNKGSSILEYLNDAGLWNRGADTPPLL